MGDAVFLFPGQGSQALGMGMALADHDPDLGAMLARAEQLVGLPLAQLIRRGPMRDLTATQVLQPALCVVSAIMLEATRRRGIDAVAVAGHSLGELTACHAAGAFDFETLVRLAAARGRLMQETADRVGGGMVAVNGPQDKLAEGVGALLAVAGKAGKIATASFNSPRQTVLAGDQAALTVVVDEAPGLGLAARALPVSGPWHSPAMAPAAEAFGAVLEKEAIGDCRLAVWSAVDAQPIGTAHEVTKRLAGAIDHPLKWTDTVRALWASHGDRPWAEVGPGKVLTGLVLETERTATLYRVETAQATDRLVRACQNQT